MSAGLSSSPLRAWANGSIVLVFCFSLGLLFLVMSRQDAVFLDATLPDTTNNDNDNSNSNDNSHHHHQQQASKHSFRGTFSEPEVLWAPTYRVASYHYQIAADEGPSHCAGKKYTWEACPGPSPSHINATLQHGIFELHCPAGVVGLYSVDIHGNGTQWNEYPGNPVMTNATAVIARCTTRDCEKFLDSQHMCPKDDVFLTQVLLRPDVSARRVDVNLPLNVLVLFTDSAPRADYVASLLQTEKVLRELEETDHHTTFSFPFYNAIGQGTKRWFYSAMGRNSTANPSVFSPTPEGKEGIPWVWEQFRGHGYATGISMEGCWCGETEDFFRSYPYGGPSEDWGTNWNYYEELGDYQLMNVFCAVDVKDGSYRRDNTQYDVELDKAPICLGGDYQSNKFYEWGFQFIDAQERMNRDGHRDALQREGQRVQPWYLYHQTMYAHGPSPCAGMQFTDMQMAKYIRRLHKHGYMNNTMLVLVSDHGNGYFYDNPFLALTVPNWVLNAQPEIGRSLEHNQHQLISGYDIYMTLTHLLNYPSEYHHPRFDDYAKRNNGQSLRGRSLLSAINWNRTCDDVGVPSTSCCVGQFKLEKLDPEDKAVVHMARQALEFVNNETEPFRSACHLWTFARVLKAKRLGDTEVVIYQTRENQGQFKASFAGGRMASVKQLSIWNPNKKCMPNGVRMEYCQCLPVTISN